MDELRDLAAGIHPAVLSQRGLDAALESLASRAPVPVELDSELEERLPSAVETAAYFVVAEALTNVAKYADATHARVEVRRENGAAVIDVRDDGVGGADAAAGTGLRGLERPRRRARRHARGRQPAAARARSSAPGFPL